MFKTVAGQLQAVPTWNKLHQVLSKNTILLSLSISKNQVLLTF